MSKLDCIGWYYRLIYNDHNRISSPMERTISVIIPTHYRNDLLPRAIDSVLAQDYDPLEVIVVDDSGERHAEPVLTEYDHITPIYHEENRGWAGANTSGIEASTGEYIQFLDDDDYLLEGKLSKTAAILDEDPTIGVSYCGVIKGDEGRFPPKPEVKGNILESALKFQTFPLWTGSMLIRREVLEDCMPLAGMSEDHDLDIELGDTDLKIELAKRTDFGYVDECLAYYHQGGNKLWTGPRKFWKVKQNVRHQREVYNQYPELKRELLTEWYQRQAIYWLEQRIWSPRAIACFMKSMYHAQGLKAKAKAVVATAASLFGLPGWNAIERTKQVVSSSSGG